MLTKTTWAAFLVAALLGIAGCENDGPAEELGEEIDDTAEELEDAID